MPLFLTRTQARQMSDHARRERPREACGLIAGDGDKVRVILPLNNVHADPARHFSPAPADLLAALKRFDAQGLTLLGIYHSHPKGDPIPSAEDVREARQHYPHIAHLIVGLRGGEARLSAWHISAWGVEQVALVFAKRHHEREPALSNAQQRAVILMTVLVVLVMLALSVALLPPAPDLPLPTP